jgi:hypothetical protein
MHASDSGGSTGLRTAILVKVAGIIVAGGGYAGQGVCVTIV